MENYFEAKHYNTPGAHEYTIVKKSSSRRTICIHYKGNQSKLTTVIGMYTTVHKTGLPHYTNQFVHDMTKINTSTKIEG